MQTYLNLLRDIIDNGTDKPDRTGVGTRSVFGRMIRFDLNDGFPIVTTKRIHWKSVVAELLWMLSGGTNSRDLEAQGVTIWKDWSLEDGSLGPIYGAQWRNWHGLDTEGARYVVDQMEELVGDLHQCPFSRAHVVSAWNPSDVPRKNMSPQDNVRQGFAALAPCHCLFQVIVEPTAPVTTWGRTRCNTLSLKMTQRSADAFLGVPFNIASYALLTHMLAEQCDMFVGDLVIDFGDLHLYRNHIHPDIVYEQLRREPLPLPRLLLKPGVPDIFSYHLEDIKLDYYRSHPAIKAPIAV